VQLRNDYEGLPFSWWESSQGHNRLAVIFPQTQQTAVLHVLR